MGEQQYEHHITIRRDKLCPFIHRSLKDLHTSVCNWHRNLEIMLVTRGEGRMKYDCDDISIGEHDVIVVNSGALHRPYSDSGVSFNYIIIDEGFCTETQLPPDSINHENFPEAVLYAGEKYDYTTVFSFDVVDAE